MDTFAKTIVIFSTKGGTGRTFLATNLAAALAKHKNKKVALLDFDFEAASDMSRSLNITPTIALVELALMDKKEWAKQEVGNYIKKHDPSGVDFIPIILKPSQARYLDDALIDKVITDLKSKYDYIIIDGGRTFSDSLVSALNHANLVLFVTTPDILAIYQSKWAMDILQSLHFPLKMIRVVLNRSNSLGGVTFQEVKLVFPCDIISRLPSEGRTVGFSLNRRMPVVLDSPRSKVSLAIKKLSDNLVSDSSLFMDHVYIRSLDLSEDVSKQLKGTDSQAKFLEKHGLKGKLKPSQVLISEDIISLKRRVHQRLITELDLKRMEVDIRDKDKMAELRIKTGKAIANAIAKESGALISSAQMREQLIRELLDEALGLGPLEDLMADGAITDIMVNNKDDIYVERFGKLEKSNKKFISNEQVKQVIERIIAPLGRRIDESVPMVDARLSDGSRVNAIIPPLSLGGPMLTIRKFARERYEISDLIKFGTVNQPMADFIKACVVMRKNIIVSGGTGSGKTTVLNVLSSFIPENERIITIEDAAELKLHQDHWARLESRAPNIEGKGAISIRDLFRNTLRMRPDRIVIGECRGGESLDMLQAMNTGHDGSMTTVHANSAQDVLARLDSLILMSGAELPIRAIREMIASAVDVIVHSARLSDGARKIMAISEIIGMGADGHVDMEDIFIYKQTGLDENCKVTGYFQATGHIPSFYDDLKLHGIKLSKDIFKAPKA